MGSNQFCNGLPYFQPTGRAPVLWTSSAAKATASSTRTFVTAKRSVRMDQTKIQACVVSNIETSLIGGFQNFISWL